MLFCGLPEVGWEDYYYTSIDEIKSLDKAFGLVVVDSGYHRRSVLAGCRYQSDRHHSLKRYYRGSDKRLRCAEGCVDQLFHLDTLIEIILGISLSAASGFREYLCRCLP